LRIMNVALLSQPQRELRAYLQRVAGDGGTVETPDEASTFVRRLRSAGVLGSTVIAGVAGGVKAGTLYSIIGPDLDVTRGTVKNRVNRAGVLNQVASGVPATDFAGGVLRGTTVEPSAVNQIRNNTMQGAVVGSPGTLPTNHSVGATVAGLTRSIVDVSSVNDVDFIEYRFAGVASGTAITILFETDFAISASLGQIWTISSWVSRNGVFPGGTAGLGFQQRNASGVYLSEFTGPNVFVDTGFTRKQYTTTTNAATIAFVRPYLALQNLLIGQSYDFTIRIGLPQMELGSVATSVIKTTNSAQTRNADVITKTGLGSVLVNGQGTILLDFIPLSLPDTTYQRLLGIDDGTSLTNGYDIGYGGGGFGNVARTTFRIGATPIFDSAQGAITIGQRQKVAFAFANNDFQVALNGSLQAASLSGSTNIQHSRVILGGRSDGTGNNIIHSFAYFPTRLPNATLQTLTTL
jgi:hypothetical protein